MIDLAGLFNGQKEQVAKEIGDACRNVGFFYIKNHGIDNALVDRLMSEGKRFFALPLEEKQKIDMSLSPCYRGFFELGGELTSKRKDWKEGYYFGADLPESHPDVAAKVPMHGPNLWPTTETFEDFGTLVMDYMNALTELGHLIMEGVALSLGLEEKFFRTRFTEEAFTPFRLFHYPLALSPAEKLWQEKNGGAAAGVFQSESEEEHLDGTWGVAQHTDYGVLTILKQDDIGGLQVKNGKGDWVRLVVLVLCFACRVVCLGSMGKYECVYVCVCVREREREREIPRERVEEVGW